jgi:hypothetical protein
MKNFIIFCLILCSNSTLCYSETIKLKNGNTIEGRIIEKTEQYITVEFEAVPITYYFDEIESIDGKPGFHIKGTAIEEGGTLRQDVEIIGSARFVNQIEAALTLIREKDTEAYNNIIKYIGRIQEADHSGMAASLDPPTFFFNERSAFYSLTWCAGDIAHDSYHSKLYHDYKAKYGDNVPNEIWTGQEIEMKCLRYQIEVMRKIGAPQGEIDYLKSLDGSHYKVEFDKRGW